MTALIITGDCRQVMAVHGPFDMVLADPPYQETSLEWDRWPGGWVASAAALLKPTGSLWCFGSLRLFMERGHEFSAAGMRLAQDVVWEKHNGSGTANDRFRRVHECAVQFYRADSPWSGVYNDVQRVPGAARPSAKIKANHPPKQFGKIGTASYEYGDTRIARSVIKMPTMHGRAIHPTEKPAALLEILVRTSCPPGGLVGDFFAGSGAGGDACLLTGRHYVGAEADPVMAEKARARLSSNIFMGAAE